MDSPTMMTYIHEEVEVCKNIIKNHEDNLKLFEKIVLKKPQKQWLILATGSSFNAVMSAKYFIEKFTGISVDIQEPFNFFNYEKVRESVDLVLAVSQSGHSYSTIEAIKKVKNEFNVDTVALTSNLDSPITKNADISVDIGCGVEKVGFVTKGFTSTVLTLMLMALKVSKVLGKLDEQTYLSEIEKLTDLASDIPKVIDLTEKFYVENKDDLIKSNRFMTIGYGGTYGIAKECETKFTETIRVPSQGFELEAFMHGPYLEVNKDHRLIFIENKSIHSERLNLLNKYFKDHTKYCYKITTFNKEEDSRILGLNIEVDEFYSIFLLAIPFQVLAYRIATDKGIDLNKRIFDDFDKVLKSKI